MSRSRKNSKATKRSTPQVVQPEVLDEPGPCDCPACSSFDPEQLVNDLVADAADLLGSEDPLHAELLGATLLAVGELAGDGFEDALVSGFIPAFEAQSTTAGLAMLLAVGSVSHGRAAEAASAAAGRLVGAGIAAPRWAAEMDEPVTTAGCSRLYDMLRSMSVLSCTFHRAGRSHAVIVTVDHHDCGAAGHILLLDGERLPEALEVVQADCMAGGVATATESLDPAEFRWHVEKALAARAVHDDEKPLDKRMNDVDDEDEGPEYPAMAVLLRARMRLLPEPSRPAPSHDDEGAPGAGLAALQALLQTPSDSVWGRRPVAMPRQPAAAKLPAKRKKSAGPAPVYRIKVALRGAKPPIWRRLEVPADISLARLHEVIQIAFDWDDCHMHVFETPYGSFGVPDAELGHRSAAQATLEQVAPAVDSKLRYTYDFGDDWEHEIVVEKVLDRDGSTTYPRCTGGRRAAPPEDCGGIWGYAALVETLNDPSHPDHEDQLEWLGLDSAADFDPVSFDAEGVTKALSALR
ncbi:MAG TPA: plasmid pRiA4b ORF-3 family protein [Micromonosporaceae bacterium]|nr:plasmid pRiA4b ORF-3 family protein [Micromonosporaceae bacterium]